MRAFYDFCADLILLIYNHLCIIASMKKYFYFLTVLVSIFLAGCNTKTVTYTTKISVDKKDENKKIKNKLLMEIAEEIKNDSDATLNIQGQPASKNEDNIALYLTNRYLKIGFNAQEMFKESQTNLSDEAKYYIQKIIPALREKENIIIQVIGHAYDEGEPKQLQHYSDLRAISVAEMLFNSGLKQDILAKGCTDSIPKRECNLNEPHNLCSMNNRRVNLYIYTSKDDIITKCR